jgi:hypothetical protein
MRPFEPISLVFSPDFPDPSVAGTIAVLDPKDYTGPNQKTTWTIGKSKVCDIQLAGKIPFFSRIHASIILRKGVYYLIDGGVFDGQDKSYHPSTNGVYKGSDRIFEEDGDQEVEGVPIEPGDKLTLGIPTARVLIAEGRHPTLNQYVWDKGGWADFQPKLPKLKSDIHQQLEDASKPAPKTVWDVIMDVINYLQEPPKNVLDGVWKILVIVVCITTAIVTLKYLLPFLR